jgi:outer membrane protein
LGDFLLPFEIPDRDFSLNLGTEIIWNNKFGSISYQITKDVISVHSGTDMILDFNKSWSAGRWRFATNTGLHWKSSQLVDYYYGVDYSFQSIVGLQYKGKSATDWFAGFRANYRLTNNLSLVASYKFTGFGSAIRNSPIINDNNKQVIFTGLFYRF